MLDLAKKIREILVEQGHEAPHISLKAREEIYGKGYEDCQRRRPKIDKARSVLGWHPQHRLDDFLPELVEAIVARHLDRPRTATTA